MIKIKINTANTINYLAGLNTNLRKAQISATNKMAKQARSEASREIRKKYNVTVKGLTTEDASGKNVLGYTKAHAGRSNATVVARGAGLGLKYFSSRQVNTGVSVEVKRGKRYIIKSAFGKNIPRLGGHVFIRGLKEGSTTERVARTPIKRLLGPGVAAMLRSKKVSKAVLDFVDQKFKSIMDHEIKYFLKIK